MYKINDKIKIEELQEVAKGMTYKALKVISTNGDKLAFEILEGKKPDIMEDLRQEVILQLILNDYVISKECFKIVRKILYHKTKEVLELVIDEDNKDQENENNKKAYITYINNEYKTESKSNVFNVSLLLDDFTERQREIINIYSKINSMGKTAELLGIAKGTVNNTIRRLREKIQALSI